MSDLTLRTTDCLTCYSKTFARNDLPKEHRVVKEGNGGAAMTMDLKPERYVFIPFIMGGFKFGLVICSCGY